MPSELNLADAALQQRVGNRRVTIRYRCAPATAGKLVTSEDHEYQRAWIDNLSRGGVGLFLSKPVAAGNVVVLHLKSPTGGQVHELSGQVVHATLREPYGWYVGIEFLEPLTEETLDSLL